MRSEYKGPMRDHDYLVAGQGRVEVGDGGLERGSSATGPVGGTSVNKMSVFRSRDLYRPIRGQYYLPGGDILPSVGLHLETGHQPHLLIFPGEVITGDTPPHQGPAWP